MRPRLRLTAGSTFAALLLLAATAAAIPNIQSASDTDDDAKITLRALTQTIDGDRKSWCEVRIEITEADEPLTSGDPVYLWVYEDDFAGDDTIWSTTFNVTAAEASANRVDRTFDCSAFFDNDSGSQLEIYAEARVEKDECGFGCAWDRPETGLLDLDIVTDDNREENDSSNVASGLSLGNNNNLIARDQDWYTLALSSPSRITFDTTYRTNTGRIDMTFFDTTLTDRGSVSDTDTGGTLVIERAEAGDYLIRLAPRNSGDFNFYDLRMTVDTLAADCVVGATEDATCGRCGTQTRTCDNNGRWGPFGACTDEGVCAPGEQMSEGCGSCGTRLITCTEACAWGAPAACAGEGECAAGSSEEVNCNGGTQSRTCDDECVWGEFTACGQIICEENAVEPCYTGPEGTEGVGACRAGSRRCTNNAWGDCRGEVVPSAEVCADNLDNDCDGQRDGADTECAESGAPLGDPCADDAACRGALECVKAPQDPQFEGGYCGKAECASDAECGSEGFCATVFDENYCLDACQNTGDCRDGYLCAEVGGRMGCIPRCRADNHCRGTSFPSCNPDTGLCEAVPANNNPGNNTPANNNPGNNTPSNNTPSNNNPGNNSSANNSTGNTNNGTTPAEPTGTVDACACATPARTPAAVTPWLLLGLVGVVGALLRRKL